MGWNSFQNITSYLQPSQLQHLAPLNSSYNISGRVQTLKKKNLKKKKKKRERQKQQLVRMVQGSNLSWLVVQKRPERSLSLERRLSWSRPPPRPPLSRSLERDRRSLERDRDLWRLTLRRRRRSKLAIISKCKWIWIDKLWSATLNKTSKASTLRSLHAQNDKTVLHDFGTFVTLSWFTRQASV